MNYCRNCGIESPHEDLPVIKKKIKKPNGILDAIRILEGRVWVLETEMKKVKKNGKV